MKEREKGRGKEIEGAQRTEIKGEWRRSLGGGGGGNRGK